MRRFRAVVVVNDDEVRSRLRAGLDASDRFAVVGEAATAEVGVEMARSTRPDVVLLDVDMPGGDGFEAMAPVRDACPSDTVIVVTAATPSPGLLEAIGEGDGTAFVRRDLDVGRLVEELVALVEHAVPLAGVDAVQWRFPAALTSGALARKRLRELARRWQLCDLLDEVELLASELVNNAVEHAGTAVLLTVRRRTDVLRVEVTDLGAGTLHRRPADVSATCGRGLLLVEALAMDWGTAVNDEAKTVWFELPTDGA